jgi:hypothetical protein
MIELSVFQIALLVVITLFGRDALATIVDRQPRRAQHDMNLAVDAEQREHLQELRQLRLRRLRHLERQAAISGIRTDPATLIEIEDIQHEIAKIDTTLFVAGGARSVYRKLF